ncbi:PLAC8 family-domain-containing protein [Cantharellus anzutake]|uniref:PLAC8 family-domain-containing protein n=1 Tax=Cantharellus anzutake TaxID=1750568 RepID=UPI001904B5AE|nr:PLAC8 family-domain-containing protein [Cantharellus anzutake]KAF8325763.1 PLAC8 family-domain-containing protein [Cantharellus anzutake]
MSEKPIVQQPGAMPQMLPGGNRNALNKPFDQQGEREWSHGTFDCFSECGLCLFSWCCSCFSYGKNKSRLQYLQINGQPHPQGGEMVNSDCVVFAALLYCGCPCLVSMGTRKEIRTRYKIQGGGGSDFLCSWCCAPCSLVQESRELTLEENSFHHVSFFSIHLVLNEILT